MERQQKEKLSYLVSKKLIEYIGENMNELLDKSKECLEYMFSLE
jgi:hypothetical protein